MSFNPPDVGTLTRWGMSAGTSGAPTAAYEYKSFSLGKHTSPLDTAGIRGVRGHPTERTVLATYAISGQVGMDVSIAELNVWLTAAWNSGAATIPYQQIGIDRIAAGHQYNSCKVDKLTIKASQGGFVEVTADIEGLTETAKSGGWLSAISPAVGMPATIMSSALTIGGTTYYFREVEVVIDNGLKKDRFMNNIARTDLPELDRIVTLALSLPYCDASALYDALVPGSVGVAAVTFGDGTNTRTLTFNAWEPDTSPIETPGREEILLPLRGRCFTSSAGSVLELVES
jgi:Phage tail tube protein